MKNKANDFFLIVLLTSVIFYCILIIFYNRDLVVGLVATKSTVPSSEITDVRTLTGVLKKIIPPPSDDIGYKYILELDKKFQTVTDDLLVGGSGLAPQTMIVVLSPTMSEVDFLKLINHRVSLTGKIAWGYAESKYINAESFVTEF